MIGFFKTIYFCLLVVTLTFYYALAVVVVSYAYRLRGKKFPFTSGHKIGSAWGRRIMKLTPGWTVSLSGEENVPPKGTSYIVVANHESATDIFTIYALGIPFRWLAKAELFKIPLFGYVARVCGHIPIQRGVKTSHIAALELCAQSVREGIPVFLFPEGTRSTEARPKKFKIGAFKLAHEAQVPVLPIVLFGAGKLLKKGSLTPNRANLRISILPLVPLIEDESVDQLTQRVEDIVVKEHTRLSQA